MGEEKVNLEQFLALMHNLQQKQSHSIVALCFHLTNIKKCQKKKKCYAIGDPLVLKDENDGICIIR
jgi:hypothetical protein